MAIEKILNKRSNDVVTGGGAKRPTSSQLDNGEIAINYHKGTERLFIKNDNDEIVEFVTKDKVDELLADKVNSTDLATVATSGSYNDLNDKPTINTGVTSVGLSMPSTYFTVASSPITTSGTLTVSLNSAYTIPTTTLLNSFVKCTTQTVSITEDTLYDAGTIADQKHVFFVNSTTDTDFVVTINNSSPFKTPDGHVLQLTVPADGYAECNFIKVNGTIFVRGI